jgi:hypothetical protein
MGVWADPRAGLDDVEKRKFLTQPELELHSDPSVIQLVGSCYTDYDILSPGFNYTNREGLAKDET